jgi:hypothetical protein
VRARGRRRVALRLVALRLNLLLLCLLRDSREETGGGCRHGLRRQRRDWQPIRVRASCFRSTRLRRQSRRSYGRGSRETNDLVRDSPDMTLFQNTHVLLSTISSVPSPLRLRLPNCMPIFSKCVPKLEGSTTA